MLSAEWCFLWGLSCLLTHELDAMKAREWHILPGLWWLDDEWGERLFIALHIPLFTVVLWGPFFSHAQQAWQHGLSIFFIAHMVAHMLLHTHPENRFRRKLSWLWIVGCALGGVGYLCMA